jgi:hypothetical protein
MVNGALPRWLSTTPASTSFAASDLNVIVSFFEFAFIDTIAPVDVVANGAPDQLRGIKSNFFHAQTLASVLPLN